MKRINENVAANRVAFTATLNNAKMVGNKKFASIDLTLLEYDEEYQRGDMINSTTLGKLIRNFDPNKMDAIRVVAHPESYTFAIVDGIHRTLALKAVSGDDCTIEAEIIDAANAKDRQRFEASLFVKQNENVERLSALQKHNAGVLLGIKEDVILDRICGQYNIETKKSMGGGRYKAGTLSGFAEALDFARVNPEDLELTFEIIYNAGWIYEKSALTGTYLRAFKNLLKFHNDKKNVILRRLPKMLRSTSPFTYEADSVSKYPLRNVAIAITLNMEDYMNSVANIGTSYKDEMSTKHPEIVA